MIRGKKIISLWLIFLSVILSVHAQDQDEPYAAHWRKVYLYELNKLPKSALGMVDTIFVMAKKENNHSQIVKSLIYKSKFNFILEENAQLFIVRQLNHEIGVNKFPVKNILESVLGNLYWQYYTQNRWRFYNRTHTTEKVDKSDFRTWDLTTIFEEAHLHFQSSLKNAENLKKLDLALFKDILLEEKDSKKYRPSLYDFLCHNALEFYKADEYSITNPASNFNIDDPGFFMKFGEVSLKKSDSLSLPLEALKIYQDLFNFHSKNNNVHALISVDLERLEYVRSLSNLQNKEDYYLRYLEELSVKYKKHEIYATLAFKIASLYNHQASAYQPKIKEANRFKKREALKICEEAIQAFPESTGSQMCQQLKDEILAKSINILAEAFIPIHQASRLLVEYKNTDSLYFTILRIEEKELKLLNTTFQDSARSVFLKSLPVERKFFIKLRNENDYQTHKTEALLSGLPQGRYIVHASLSNKAESYGPFDFSIVQVTNLAIVEKNTRHSQRYQVIDRNTGRPAKGAKVQFTPSYENQYSRNFDKTFLTDESGHIEFLTNDYHYNLQTIVSHNGDQAYFGDYYLSKNGNEGIRKENVIVKSFLFTDRSIYRPGQKVYFKGILLKKQGAKSELVVDEKIEVYLEDVNGQEVKRVSLSTNAYGSFSGEFILPMAGLTGRYSIHVEEDADHDSELFDEFMHDFDGYGHFINVEE